MDIWPRRGDPPQRVRGPDRHLFQTADFISDGFSGRQNDDIAVEPGD